MLSQMVGKAVLVNSLGAQTRFRELPNVLDSGRMYEYKLKRNKVPTDLKFHSYDQEKDQEWAIFSGPV